MPAEAPAGLRAACLARIDDVSTDRIFGNPMATAAAIDGVVHHSVILEFDVPSYRTAGAKAAAKKAEPHQEEVRA